MAEQDNNATTAKKPAFKWTSEHEATARELYDPSNSDATVAEIMDVLGIVKRSVIGKLVSMKNPDGERLYCAPEKPKAAKKDDGPTKGEIETALIAKYGEGFAEGASGATKSFLTRVLELNVVED